MFGTTDVEKSRAKRMANTKFLRKIWRYRDNLKELLLQVYIS